MKGIRCKNLHLAGIDILFPALVCIDSPQAGRRHTSVFIGFADLYADNIVGSLVGQWLEHQLHRPFVEHARGDEGDLAAAAFYDKLAYDFAGGAPFVSALVVAGDRSLESTLGVSHGTSAWPASGRTRNAVRSEQRALASLVHGDEFAKWNFSGRVRAYVGTGTGTAQVSFEDLPGGIELVSTKSAPRTLGGTREVSAWYGFGMPLRNPADAVVKLRNEIASFDRPRAEPRTAHAAHA